VTFIKQREFLMLEVVTDASITGWGGVAAAPYPAAARIEGGATPTLDAQLLDGTLIRKREEANARLFSADGDRAHGWHVHPPPIDCFLVENN